MKEKIQQLITKETTLGLSVKPFVLNKDFGISGKSAVVFANCSCSNACGTNYSRGNCSCSNSCGNNFSKSGNCSCYTTCGNNYAQ